MKVIAEIKRVSSKKQSLDMVYQLVLETNDPQILELGALPADQLVNVEIKDAQV